VSVQVTHRLRSKLHCVPITSGTKTNIYNSTKTDQFSLKILRHNNRKASREEWHIRLEQKKSKLMIMRGAIVSV